MNLTPKEIIEIRKGMTRPRFLKFILFLGFVQVGHGMYRKVYYRSKGKFVIKLGDKYHNLGEARAAEKLPKKYVATVLAHHEDTLVQKYIAGKRCNRWSCTRPKCLKHIGDWHAGNHRHIGKAARPVVFDLGFGT